MKRKSLNLGGSRSAEDMDKVINKLNVQMSSEEEAALKGKPKTVEVEKARVTHYLSTNILSDLEDVYDELRRKLPFNEKSKVKKSHIVDLALELIVEDYHKKGDKSQLVKTFIK
jgi:uncharacterized protein YifN (PemK superfamily)